MALVKCNECGSTISETATKCPNCGAGHFKAVGSSEGQKVLGAFLIIAGICLLIFFLNAGYSDVEKPISVYFLCGVIIIIGVWVLSAKGKQKIKDKEKEKEVKNSIICKNCGYEVILEKSDYEKGKYECPYCYIVLSILK